MDLAFSRFFWGFLIVLIGLFLIMNGVLKVNVPIIRIVFSIFLIYMGITLLLGAYPFNRHITKAGEETFLFTDSKSEVFTQELNQKYNSLFSNHTLDLRKIDLSKIDQNVEVNAVFGSQEIIIDPKVKVKILVNSAFANVELPDGKKVRMGTYIYSNNGSSDGNEFLIKANALFGTLSVKMMDL